MDFKTKDIPYKRPYKMRAQGQDGLNTVVSIPPQVIIREAEKRGISVEEFIKRFRAIAHYDNFEGVFYAFEDSEESSRVPEVFPVEESGDSDLEVK